MTRTTIKRNKWDEYVVRLHVNGRHIPEADYFTDDFEDAKQTAEHMEGSANHARM